MIADILGQFFSFALTEKIFYLINGKDLSINKIKSLTHDTFLNPQDETRQDYLHVKENVIF